MNIQIIDIIVGALLAYGLVHGYYKALSSNWVRWED